MQVISGMDYDKIVGERLSYPVIVAGECAFSRCGLTSYLANTIQAWTMYLGIDGIWCEYIMYYFSPWYNDYYETRPSKEHPNILEVTRERAIVEYIIWSKHFDEGILIEGVQTYLNETETLDKLYEVGEHFHLDRKCIDYWIEEAINDCQRNF